MLQIYTVGCWFVNVIESIILKKLFFVLDLSVRQAQWFKLFLCMREKCLAFHGKNTVQMIQY